MLGSTWGRISQYRSSTFTIVHPSADGDSIREPVPLPPPLDQHERLFPKKPAHVPFKQIVQRCLQQDQTACLRVSGGYYGLPRSENSKTNDKHERLMSANNW
ncbi:hypothetical protein F0U59_38625 [Archangium gephyra]|nr:hypothetical protein F0U59_38625 [Archangium gephyra]